ncbi:MAG TPA: hypothetical protein VF006_09080 [Longimicrobium sp.]
MTDQFKSRSDDVANFVELGVIALQSGLPVLVLGQRGTGRTSIAKLITDALPERTALWIMQDEFDREQLDILVRRGVVLVVEDFDPTDRSFGEWLLSVNPPIRIILISESYREQTYSILLQAGYPDWFVRKMAVIDTARIYPQSVTEPIPPGLQVSADIPDWVDEEVAAEAVADFIRALSQMHRAIGGGGLVVDGMDVERAAFANV